MLNSWSDSPNLDVLRSFAVLAVAASHFYMYLDVDPRFAIFAHNLGVAGVCFFFVHTSLVLFASMERTKTSNLTRNFYIRRAFRIYPLCWFCILLVLLTGWTDLPHGSLVEMGWRGIAAAFIVDLGRPHDFGCLFDSVQSTEYLSRCYFSADVFRRNDSLPPGLQNSTTNMAFYVAAGCTGVSGRTLLTFARGFDDEPA